MKTNSMSVFDFARIDYVTILLPFSVKHQKDGRQSCLKALKNPSLLKLRDGGMSENLVGASSNVVCMDTANLNKSEDLVTTEYYTKVCMIFYGPIIST